MDARVTASVDLGKSRCRVLVTGPDRRIVRDGVGAPGLAAAGGVKSALEAILRLLSGDEGLELVGVGAAGAWLAPDAARDLASSLAAATGAQTAVASDVVTAHAGALDGGAGVLLIAGTGAAALGIDSDGARLVDGWGPELGDLGSGSWLGREALRAVLRANDSLGPSTVLTAAIADPVGDVADIQAWLAGGEPFRGASRRSRPSCSMPRRTAMRLPPRSSTRASVCSRRRPPPLPRAPPTPSSTAV